MITSTIDEAQSQLAELIMAAEQGEEVVIARAGKPVARLLAYQRPDGPRQAGQWRGCCPHCPRLRRAAPGYWRGIWARMNLLLDTHVLLVLVPLNAAPPQT